MVEALIKVNIAKDENDIPQYIDYLFTNLLPNARIGLYLDSVVIWESTTDSKGNLSGRISTVDSKFNKGLMSHGGFRARLRDGTKLPKSGIIAGTVNVVEDSDNDGLTNVGTWTLDVRYQ